MVTGMRVAMVATIVGMALAAPATGQEPTGIIRPAAALPWSVETPGTPVQISVLWGDRAAGPAGVLLKVPGGWDSGPHGHTADYHAFVIAGRWVHAAEIEAEPAPVLGPGSYFAQRRAARHTDRCLAGPDCVVFVYTGEPVATLPAASTSTPQAGATRITPSADLQWARQSPTLPQHISLLWGSRDRGPYGEFVKLPSGFDSGLHAHTGSYHGVLVSGTWIHLEANGAGDDLELGPGSYVMQPGGGMHVDRCKAGAECVLFIFQDSKADVLWPSR
jgi:hypothetical protein